MLNATYNPRKCSLPGRFAKFGALFALVGTLALNSASADITVAPDFPVKESHAPQKNDPAKSLIESYRSDVLTGSGKVVAAAGKNLALARN